MQNQLLRPSIIEECRGRLLELKARFLNQVRENRAQIQNRELGGDEADLSLANLAENQAWANERRLRQTLLDIETALARIEQGRYGVCEETEEPIEIERLLAIPWTHLSIEGAEIREEMTRRRALR